VQPVPVLLCLLAYPPFLLTLARWGDIVRSQARMAALGHLIAGFVVVVAWLLAGRPAFAAIHVAWLVVARLWFAAGARRRASTR
jgi:hypothetical protein